MSPRRRKHSPARRAPSVAPGRDRATPLRLLVLSVASFALYARTLWNGFVRDDHDEVLGDQLIRSFANVPTLFTHSVWFFISSKANNYYRPLKLLSYSVEYHLFGFHPAFWHLANVLINLAVVLVIYFLVRDLALASGTGTPAYAGAAAPDPPTQLAFWSALFFAFHPIHVEAVAWIAAGNDLLCGLALLLALWFYHRALYRTVQGSARLPRPEDSSGHLRRVGAPAAAGKPAPTALLLYAGSVALFFAGLLFKETALTFPAVILAYDFFYRGESLREMLWGWRRYLPYFAVLGFYLALRMHALHGFAPAAWAPLHLTLKDMVLSVPVLAVKYLWKEILPINQNWWYSYQPIRALGWKPIAAIALVLALVLAMFWLRPVPSGTGLQSPDSSGRGRQPLLSFALAWFWLALIPSLDIPKVSLPIFHDRYLYVSSFGFCVFAAWTWLWLRDRAASPLARRGAYACLLALLVFYIAVIFRRLPDWQDDFHLLKRTAQQSPNSARINGLFGVLYLGRGQFQDALGPLKRAVALDPTEPLAHTNLGVALLRLGRYEEALRETQQAVDLEPDLAPAWSNLCSIYNTRSHWGKAIEACQRSLALHPGDYSTLTQLGLALWNDGQRAQALAAHRHAIQLEPERLEARLNLAICLADVGQYDAALDQIAAGLRTDPNSHRAYLAHYELGVIYQEKRLWQEAAQQFQQALEAKPDFAAARTQLEAARAHLARPQP